MPDYDLARGQARADLCRFLAACYYQPGPEFAEERLFDSMRQAGERIDAQLAAGARRLGEEFSVQGIDALLVDYARLFLGPTQMLAAPYGSVWLEGEKTAMGETTVAVQALYRDGGFEVADDFRELPDHVAAELEFLYLLIHRENEAHRNSDQESRQALEAWRRRLLGEHLGRWAGPFASAVEREAQTAFYRTLATMTGRFVALESVQRVA